MLSIHNFCIPLETKIFCQTYINLMKKLLQIPFNHFNFDNNNNIINRIDFSTKTIHIKADDFVISSTVKVNR